MDMFCVKTYLRKTVKGRTTPIEEKKKTKAILATDLLCMMKDEIASFSAFKYPASNKSMGAAGVHLYTPTAHLFHHLHKRAEQ